ncbi:MAG TPA: hypothetical protein VE650_12195 [Acetobacteraceae bacterium]|nr:hypothetical protein [Acetobacteraceae bacterium]
MRLKVYQAPNIGAAMAMVRTELGPDALIVATRQADGGIEVTAALEASPSPAVPLPDPVRDAALRWHGVPEALGADLRAGDLTRVLEAKFRFGTLPLGPGAPPLLLVGPPGAGKTLTVARLATRLVLSGQLPLVITADGRRAGAAEQLAAFTRLLGLTLIAADEPVPLARALARRQEGAPVLIDSPGLNPADPGDRALLADLLAASGAVAALVLPAGLDPDEAGEIAERFRDLGASLLVATRLDQSRRLGGILSAAAGGLAFSEAGIGSGPADGLCPITPAFLAERLEAASPAASPAAAAPPLPPYVRPRDGHQRRPQ